MKPPCVGQPIFAFEVNVGWIRWPMCDVKCDVWGAFDPTVRAKEGRGRACQGRCVCGEDVIGGFFVCVFSLVLW
jgi:hypothetical protein